MKPGDLRGVPDSYGQGWPSTRRCLIRAIGKLGPQTSQTPAVLFHELRSTNYAAQATAADVLGEIRPVSNETISELRDALLRTEAEHLPEWRDLAALTPPYLDNAHAALFKVNPAPEVRMIFGEQPIIPKEHLDTIYLPGADFPGWGLRLRVIRSLGQIGPPAHDALPSLNMGCMLPTWNRGNLQWHA